MKIYKLHINIVKELNNSHIFIQKTREIMSLEVNRLEPNGDDRAYNVPVRKDTLFTKEAFRTDKELKGILNGIIDRELFENFIVTNVSRFENYLFMTLKEIIIKYPQKLSVNINGIKPYKSIPLDFITSSQTYDEVLSKVISDRIISVSYATPQQYLQFFQEVTGCSTQFIEFQDYIEIKATRDLLIHNDKIINDIYLDKVGDRRRGDLNQIIPIDSDYFDFTIATMKRVSGIIRRELDLIYNN